MSRYSKLEIEGAFNVKFTTLELVIRMEYDLTGYLDIVKMWAQSDRRGEMVEVSKRFARKFQEWEWYYLYSECIKESNRRYAA